MCALVILILVFILLIEGFQRNKQEQTEYGKILISKTDNYEFVLPENPEKEAADEVYEQERPYNVSIIDDQELLSEKGFLPIRAHILKSEAIGRYLYDEGYNTDEVIVVDGSTRKEINRSVFDIMLPDQPEVQFRVTYHHVTEEFLFEKIPSF